MGSEAILILDRGNVEVVIPKAWTIAPRPGGSIKVTDPTDSCAIELSYQKYPGPIDGAPIEKYLEQALAENPEAAKHTKPEVSRRGQTTVAWCSYEFETMDTEQDRRRPAEALWCIACRGCMTALLSASWWKDDERWARRAVDRAMHSLSIGDGTQLSSPAEHWSMRPRN